MSRNGTGIIVFLIFAFLAYIVYLLIIEGRIIARSGDNGWKILIPGYGPYLYYKACESSGIFIGTIIVSVFSSFLSSIVSRGGNGTAAVIIAAIAGIISLILHYFFSINAAYAFGKSKGFAVGIFFLFPIFMGILAFEKPTEIQYASGYDAIPSSGATWKCSQCGESNPASRITCQACGFTK